MAPPDATELADSFAVATQTALSSAVASFVTELSNRSRLYLAEAAVDDAQMEEERKRVELVYEAMRNRLQDRLQKTLTRVESFIEHLFKPPQEVVLALQQQEDSFAFRSSAGEGEPSDIDPVEAPEGEDEGHKAGTQLLWQLREARNLGYESRKLEAQRRFARTLRDVFLGKDSEGGIGNGFLQDIAFALARINHQMPGASADKAAFSADGIFGAAAGDASKTIVSGGLGCSSPKRTLAAAAASGETRDVGCLASQSSWQPGESPKRLCASRTGGDGQRAVVPATSSSLFAR